MRTLIIDGDFVSRRLAYKAEEIRTPMRARARQWIDGWRQDVKCPRVIFCFSDPSRRYFRHDLFAAYKPNREEPPANLAESIDALKAWAPSRTLPGLEADDVMGLLATHPEMPSNVMLHHDKDMLTVPGQHFDPWKEPNVGEFEVSKRDADFNHLRQTIVGDPGDGYGGAVGVGAVKVHKVLWAKDDPAMAWRQVLLAFKGDETAALLNARLARILRYGEYDHAAERVRLWTPGVQWAAKAGAA